MYRITIENLNEPGNKPWVCEDVLSWGCVTKEDVALIEEEFEVQLTDDEVKEVERRCEKADFCPDMEHLRWIIKDVLDDRRFV